MKCISSNDSLQWFFSKEDHKPGRSKFEETKKCAQQHNANRLRIFFSFPNFVKQIIPNFNTLKYTHRSLNRTLTKGSRF